MIKYSLYHCLLQVSGARVSLPRADTQNIHSVYLHAPERYAAHAFHVASRIPRCVIVSAVQTGHTVIGRTQIVSQQHSKFSSEGRSLSLVHDRFRKLSRKDWVKAVPGATFAGIRDVTASSSGEKVVESIETDLEC